MEEFAFKIYLLENKRLSNNIRIRNLCTLLESYTYLQMMENTLFKRREKFYQERDNRIRDLNQEIEVCQTYNEWLLHEIDQLQMGRILS